MQLSLYAPVGACRLETGHALEYAVFLCEKLGGSGVFHDLAVRKHNNLIRRLDGTHTVGNDEDGFSRKRGSPK